MPRITISNREFLGGAGNSDYDIQGGFSPEGKGHNIRYKDGLLAPPATKTDMDDLAAGEIGLAAAAGDNGTDGILLSHIAGAANGRRINANGSIDAANTDTSGVVYNKQQSDVIGFGANTFASGRNDISQDIDGTPAWGWWTGLSGEPTLNAGAVHHFLVGLAGELLISNGYNIVSWDGTNTATPLTLVNEGTGATKTSDITCFEKYNNKIFICSKHSFETTSTKKYKNNYEMFVWDGINITSALDDRVLLPDWCYSIKNFNGRLYLFFANYISIWNGVSFIKLRDISSIMYKSDIFIKEDKMFMKEGSSVLVTDGQRWWYQIEEAQAIDCIYNVWGDDMGWTTNENVFKTDVSTFTADGKWYSKWYDFPMNVIIRSVQVVLGEDMASGDVNTIKLVDQEGDTLKTLTASYASQGAVKAVEFRNINQRCSDLQLQISSFDNLIKRIIVEYDFTRQPIKKT